MTHEYSRALSAQLCKSVLSKVLKLLAGWIKEKTKKFRWEATLRFLQMSRANFAKTGVQFFEGKGNFDFSYIEAGHMHTTRS